MEDFRNGQGRLKDSSRFVQGEIKIYRVESVVPAALDPMEGIPEVPLIATGQLWRSGDRIRVNYDKFTYRKPGGELIRKRRHSLAVNSENIYSLAEGVTPDLGILNVYRKGSPEAATTAQYLESEFIQSLDILWRAGGLEFADLLQRPGAVFIAQDPNSVTGGVVIREGGKGSPDTATFEFEPVDLYPLGFLQSRSQAGDLSAEVKERVTSVAVEDSRLPSRIVEILDLRGGNGYTRIVQLNLEPLDQTSDAAAALSRLSQESFRDMGIGYQVYYQGGSGKEEIGRRYEKPAPLAKRPGVKGSATWWYIIFANVVVISVVLAVLAYRKARKPRGR